MKERTSLLLLQLLKGEYYNNFMLMHFITVKKWTNSFQNTNYLSLLEEIKKDNLKSLIFTEEKKYNKIFWQKKNHHLQQ